MAETACVACERPVADNAPLCTKCGQRTIEALHKVPGLLDEFATTRAGLARMTARIGGSSADTALPVRVTTGRGVVLNGDRAYHLLVNTVTTWTRLFAEEMAVEPFIDGPRLAELTEAHRNEITESARAAINRGAQRAEPGAALVLDNRLDATAQAAIWLAHHRHQLRAHEAAAGLLHDITSAVAALTRYIDRPVERRYLGACSVTVDDGERCAHPLLAEIDDRGRTAAYVYCGRCRAQYDVAAIEAEAKAVAAEQLYSVAELVRMTAALGEPVPKRTLYRWAHGDPKQPPRIWPRGWRHADRDHVRITDHQVSEEDVRVYRLGDVLELAKREPIKKGTAA